MEERHLLSRVVFIVILDECDEINTAMNLLYFFDLSQVLVYGCLLLTNGLLMLVNIMSLKTTKANILQEIVNWDEVLELLTLYAFQVFRAQLLEMHTAELRVHNSKIDPADCKDESFIVFQIEFH